MEGAHDNDFARDDDDFFALPPTGAPIHTDFVNDTTA